MGEKNVEGKADYVRAAVHTHSLRSASAKWRCRVFAKTIQSFLLDLFDYRQQFLIATAPQPTHKIMATNKMCDIRFLVKIYMWVEKSPLSWATWRR